MGASLWLPSYGQGFARSRAEAAYPGLWDGLAGCWVPSLGPTGARLCDQSAYGNHGTIDLTKASWIVDREYAAYMNEPAAVSILIPHKPHLNLTPPFSLVARYRVNGPNDWYGVVMKGNYNTMPYGLFGRFVGGGVDQLYFYYKANTAILVSKGGHGFDATPGVWHTNVATYTGTTAEIWQDGRRLLSTSGLSGSSATADDIGIGSETDGGYDWAGAVAMVALYDRLIVPSEIQLLYRDPHAIVRPKSRPIAYVAGGAPPTGHPYYYESISRQIQGAL